MASNRSSVSDTNADQTQNPSYEFADDAIAGLYNQEQASDKVSSYPVSPIGSKEVNLTYNMKITDTEVLIRMETMRLDRQREMSLTDREFNEKKLAFERENMAAENAVRLTLEEKRLAAENTVRLALEKERIALEEKKLAAEEKRLAAENERKGENSCRKGERREGDSCRK
jgi:hypothetical protein